MISLRVVVPAVLMLTCTVASAGVYRWVDTEGHVHYTDKAVPNSEPVNVHTGHVQDRVAAEAAAGAPNEAQKTQLKSNCNNSKAQYESYKNAVKIVETDQLGRKHEYSPEEQKMLLDKAQKDMQDACAAAGVTITSESSSSTSR